VSEAVWIPLVAGCPMPEHDAEVLVTVEAPCAPGGTESFIERGRRFYEPDNLATDWRDGFSVLDWPHYKHPDGVYRTKYGSVLTAWMPAPKPFVKGQP